MPKPATQPHRQSPTTLAQGAGDNAGTPGNSLVDFGLKMSGRDATGEIEQHAIDHEAGAGRPVSNVSKRLSMLMLKNGAFGIAGGGPRARPVAIDLDAEHRIAAGPVVTDLAADHAAPLL